MAPFGVLTTNSFVLQKKYPVSVCQYQQYLIFTPKSDSNEKTAIHNSGISCCIRYVIVQKGLHMHLHHYICIYRQVIEIYSRDPERKEKIGCSILSFA